MNIKNKLEVDLFKTHKIEWVTYASFITKCIYWKKKLSWDDYINMVIKLAQTPTTRNDYIVNAEWRQCSKCWVFKTWDKMYNNWTQNNCKDCIKNKVKTKRIYYKK